MAYVELKLRIEVDDLAIAKRFREQFQGFLDQFEERVSSYGGRVTAETTERKWAA